MTTSPTGAVQRGQAPQPKLNGLWQDDRLLQLALFVFMAAFYGLALTDAGLNPQATPPLNLTLNSMLQHLAHGQFDVDPNVIGIEGFLKNGHILSYWGPFCALLRLPLLLTGHIHLDVTVWSCLVAVTLAGVAKVRTVLLVRRQVPPTPLSNTAFALMLGCCILGGAGIGFLRASIFQEICFWAAALGAVFVYYAIKGLIFTNFDARTLSCMAAAAGLALLTRVSTGIGLCLAFGLLLLVLALQCRSAFQRRFLLPAAILAVLLLAVGVVNYGRWGNPLTFADHTLYIANQLYPDRMPRTHRYGYFNLVRVPIGLVYYFFPLWVLRTPSGTLYFQATVYRLIDAMELPPGSFFLSDLLPFTFIAFLFHALRVRKRLLTPRAGQAIVLAAGLAVPCLLMLTAISMNYRYRMDFYPEFDLLAFLGLYLATPHATLLPRLASLRRWLFVAAAVSILTAFTCMVLYKMSDFGPSQPLLQDGLLHYYSTQLGLWLKTR